MEQGCHETKAVCSLGPTCPYSQDYTQAGTVNPTAQHCINSSRYEWKTVLTIYKVRK